MSPNIIKYLCLSLVLLIVIISVSEQAIYPYYKAVDKTLPKLDLKSLEGHWFGVYHRNAKEKNDKCPQLDIRVGDGYVNVTERRGNAITFDEKMEQNQYLKGKISKVIQHPAGYSVERPWFITQVEPVLVIYQVTTGNKSEDNWSVYSRSQTLNRDIVEYGAQRLVEAGAEADQNGNYGYHCNDSKKL